MATSLYDLTVPTYLQTLTALSGVLDKGAAHLGADADAVVEARLWEDMLPFRFQVVSAAHHSLGCIEGLKAGVFAPGGPQPAPGYAGLQQLIADTIAGLQKLSREEVDALSGKDMAFAIRGTQVPFTAENFVLSFSLPNFFFHSTTAYDILRSKGVPLGKRDYLGQMRIKR